MNASGHPVRNALLQKVQQSVRPGEEAVVPPRGSRRKHAAADGAQSVRDPNAELVIVMLEMLEKEQECLYLTLVQPIISFILGVLPESNRETTRQELAFEDLEKIVQDNAIVMVEWLTEKVDALSTKLKADPKEDELDEDEENMGDVDLWCLVDDGKALMVNEKWLQHLQERLLGEESQPRKAKPGEDPQSLGLVLEWVYGSIVSTAEKARDGAKRTLGNFYAPSIQEAHHSLLRALEDFHIWEARSKQAKELMSEMLKSRLEAQDNYGLKTLSSSPSPSPNNGPQSLSGTEDLSSVDDQNLPNHVITAKLRREARLTKAKVHWLVFEHLQQDKQLKSLKSQLRQVNRQRGSGVMI
jgi:hypothetical protein